MSTLSNISIKAKVAIAATLLTALAALIGLYGLRQAAAINTRAVEVRESWLPSVAKLGNLSFEVRSLRARQNRLAALLYVDPSKVDEAIEQVFQNVRDIEKAYEVYKPLIAANTRDQVLMEEFVRIWPRAKDLNARIIDQIRSGDKAKAAQTLLVDTLPVSRELDKVLFEDLEFNQKSGENAADEGRAVYDSAFKLIGFSIVLAVALGAAIAWLLVVTVVIPLGTSTAAVKSLAEGRTEIEIGGRDRGDELGILARALEVFKAGIIQQRKMEREAEEARVRSEAERIKAQEEAINTERALVNRSIGAGLAKLAAKDLTFRLNDNLPEAYAQLQSDFNHAVEQLSETLSAVSRSTGAIRSSSGEVSSAADELSKRTEQQAASLE
ncbi:MAG: methyl-accepting chemotaxis protein, partial [Hyphomicrobiales bacterium]